MTRQPYLDAVGERVIVYDGAFGTFVQDLDLGPDDFGGHSLEGCNEMLCLTRPDVIRSMHEAFFDVGVDAIETASFGSFSTVLTEYAIPEKAYELNLAAARIARDTADDYEAKDGRPRYVAGSIGPGTKLPSLGHITFADLRDAYEEQARALLDGGADLFLVETCMDLLQVKAAMIACRRAMKAGGRVLPLQVQVTMETTGRMLVGSEIGAALSSIVAMRPDVLGINCATGPAEMQEHLRYLSQSSPLPISVLPNAGLPSVVDGRTHYDLTADQLATFHRHHVADLGVGIVGGCCGTTPAHLKAVVDALRGVERAPRAPQFEPSVTSIYSPVTFAQDNSFLIIGERTNANGSKAFRDAMLAGDLDTCTKIATEQIREGAHVLDVCVDYVGRDGTADMDAIAKRFATSASVPLVLDSTEPQVLEAALQHIGGRAILNSANLEDGELPGSRMDRVFSLAREYGAAVICLLIDERGQARDVEWKLEIAHRIHEIATERYGLTSSDLIFDALTFPLSTGDDDLRRDAMETMEAIRRIKAEIPGCYTTLGVSNVSFGLTPASRHALNSVFLHECVEAGLDSAIVHSGKIVPLSKLPKDQLDVCLDLIYDRRRPKTADDPGYDPLQHFLEVFADVKSVKAVREDRSGWSVQERLKHRIIDGDREGLSADLDEALSAGIPALAIVNDVLLDGMKVVGELFGSGQMQLPFVLQSAETMKASVAHLEPHMERAGGETSKGKLVIATVKGDVHDIGKNLVDIICTNNGYEVHNLGIKVGIADMVAKVKEVGADALGMSGLLVKSTLIMRENLQELNALGLADETPVLLGGAALTRSYVERDLREVYDGRVFYGRDAFEGLHTLDKLMTFKREGGTDENFGRELTGRVLPARGSRAEPDAVDIPARSPEAETDNRVFEPPFLGTRVVKGVSLDDIAVYVNETALFRNQWQFRPESGESDEDFKTRIRPILREQLGMAKASGVLVPQVVYGYFVVNGDGNDLIVWSDESRTTELARFSYPRQRVAPFLCIADFFRPLHPDGGGVGELDYAAFHIVSMGSAVSDATAKLFANNEYQQYLLLHGIGVEMAEALAELWHRRIREEWGFAGEDGPTVGGLFRQQYRGGRYSSGYPACPDLQDNAIIAELLEAGRIGVEVSEETGWQYQPEQTTSAIICHHPRAKYFVAR
jgi:5-methyltetrahydrofolate--homocysteine methyltransferase